MSDAGATFAAERPRLLGIAYRLLGSAAEADDVLQEAWLRFAAAPEPIRSPRAFLTTVVTRLCLDVAKSARVKRTDYVGPWLPEPLPTESDAAHPLPGSDPESLSLAFLVLLETLSPLERAVFVLHQAFDYDHAEIAAILDKDVAAVRQLLHRAKEHIHAGRPRFAPSRGDHERVLLAFASAIAQGDLAGLSRVLAEDARTSTDGGGRVRAAQRTVVGSDRVARFFLGLAKKGGTGVGVRVVEANGLPALLLTDAAGKPDTLISIETDGALVYAVHVVRNPDKLVLWH